MPRAILAAPVARDLFAEFGAAVRIPDATNGIQQAWDTNERDRFIGQEGITVYLTRAAVPAVLRPYLVAVLRSDSRTAAVNVEYKRYADCGAGDYFRVRSSAEVVSVKLKSEVVAGDRPVDWTQVHGWLGIADDELGEN